MSRWFRFYNGVVSDPKAQMLPDALFRAWVNVLCIASQHQGELPPLSVTAYMLRLPEPKAAEVLTRLAAAGLLDKTENGFRPHNWDARQYRSDKDDPTNAERQRRYRNAHRSDSNAESNGESNANDSVTAKRPDNTDTDTDTDTDTESEKKETRASALVASDWPEDFREQFWEQYPHKVGKPIALKKLEAARKRRVSWTELIAGLRRYVATKPSDREWMNPATFLNQERWGDEPAASLTAVQSTTEPQKMNIEDAVKMYARIGAWSRWAGPAPGQTNCAASPELLAQYGIMPDGRRVPGAA